MCSSFRVVVRITKKPERKTEVKQKMSLQGQVILLNEYKISYK